MKERLTGGSPLGRFGLRPLTTTLFSRKPWRVTENKHSADCEKVEDSGSFKLGSGPGASLTWIRILPFVKCY